MRALALADRLDPAACALKVGKEMFVVAGPEPVRWMIERGFRVFLDLKFHDIPNTVAQACAAATRLGVWMLNVHAAGGRAMLTPRATPSPATAAERGTTAPLLIAVTVLTSLSDDRPRRHRRAPQRRAPGARPRAAHGGLRARRRRLLGGRGADAARGAARRLPRWSRRASGLAGSAKDDQARIITPEAAVANGADYLVIGRPITQAHDPLAALSAINASLGVRT